MKRKDFENLWFLLKAVYRQEKKTFYFGVGNAALEAVNPYIFMVLLGMIVDAAFGGMDLKGILLMIGIVMGAKFVLEVLQSRLNESFRKKMENYPKEFASRDLNRKALTMDYEYLEDAHARDIRFRSFQKSFYGVGGWLMMVVYSMLKSGLSIIISICIVAPMFKAVHNKRNTCLNSAWCSVFILVLLGILAFISCKISVGGTRKAMRKYFDSSAAYNKKAYYLDLLSGVEPQKDIRVMNFENVVNNDVGNLFGLIHENEKLQNNIYVRRDFLQKVIFGLSSLFIYLFAGLRAYAGAITIGNVVTYASSMEHFISSVNYISIVVGHLKSAAMYAEDHREFIELGKRKYDGTIPVEKRRDNKFSVEFVNVSFKYPGSDTYALKNINLKFVIGERMAIVGKNGSGKTTFIKLLCRLYDVTDGCIKVNDIDIRKYDYKEYCNLFAVVFQDFQIFAFPVGENVAAGSRVDEALVIEAMNKAGLGERLKQLESGLSTCVGKDYDEEGVSFSGGEKQKLAIARAVYKDASFVIMDEPTAALDPEAEAEIFEGFDKMVGKKTAIYISHRLASCRFCEDILVFDDGKVVQHGSHDELEKQEGLYRQLWNAQAQYYA
ncbi:MAG: ABC transporter ATP-binding protein/permease [Lachnospiraceae bacterium]|nr:ABC transporter ATP-binding protein/permease [Lachnospiraceae bacterium]